MKQEQENIALEQELLSVFTNTFGLSNRLVDPQTFKQKKEKHEKDWDTITLDNKLFVSVTLIESWDNAHIFRFLFEKSDIEAILNQLKCFSPYDEKNTLDEEIENYKEALAAKNQEYDYTLEKALSTGLFFLYFIFGQEKFLDLAITK